MPALPLTSIIEIERTALHAYVRRLVRVGSTAAMKFALSDIESKALRLRAHDPPRFNYSIL